MERFCEKKQETQRERERLGKDGKTSDCIIH
jgi:hypothetical protein